MGDIQHKDLHRKEDEDTPSRRLPIIPMTANSMQRDQVAYLIVGMDDYSNKPITAEAFR